MIGRLTRDAELEYMQSTGTALARFSCAVNESVKKGDEWVEYTSYFDFNLWGKRAENLFEHLKKGQRVSIDSKPKQERWEKEGAKRSRIVFNVQKIQLLGSPNENRA